MDFLLQMEPGTRKTFKCEHCQHSFTSKYRLTFHVSNYHSFMPPQSTVCSYCHKRFSNRSNLKAHVSNKHLGEKKFGCNVCDKRFGTKKDIEIHTRQHHGASKLSCEKCGPSFGYKSALTRHIESCGKQTKCFKCPACEKMFISKNALYMHKRAKHRNEINICEICVKSFNKKFCHTWHVKEVHKNDC